MAAYLNRLLSYNKVDNELIFGIVQLTLLERTDLKLSSIIRFCGSVVIPFFLANSGQRPCKHTLLDHLCGFRQEISFRYCLLIFLLTKKWTEIIGTFMLRMSWTDITDALRPKIEVDRVEGE